MKIARFAIFLTGMIGLAMGGIMSISSLQSSQEESVLKTNESLKSQAQIFVDQFFMAIESVRNDSDPARLSYVTHRGVVKLTDGIPSEVESLDALKSDGASIDLALEDRVLKALQKQVTLGDLKFYRYAIGTFELSEIGSKEGLFIAMPITKANNNISANPAIDPTANHDANLSTYSAQASNELSIILIDPAKAMASLSKLNGESRHAFLVNKNGKVLAHSVNAFVGTDLTKMDSLKNTIEGLFLGAQTGMVTHYQAMDGGREQIAFVRAGALPFAVAVEQKASPPILSMGWLAEEVSSGAARKNFGIILVMIASALALFSGVSIWLSKELHKQLGQSAVANREAREEAAANAYFTPAERVLAMKPPKPFAPNALTEVTANQKPIATPSYLTSSLAEAAQNFVETRASLTEELQASQTSARHLANLGMNVQRDYVAEFSEKAQKAYTIETIEKDLVQISSELSESPVLYFRYHRRHQNLTLSSVAGQVKVPNYTQMQAYVRKDIETQIENLANEGKVASITNYGPMSKIMISNLNVAHFEAWAVTSDAEISNGSKMVGVLVVMQAGFRSAQARPILAKILREAGNYIYAQNGKIRARTDATNAGANAPNPLTETNA
jgi:hypothetical protein